MPRVLVVWPHPRVEKERATRANPNALEQMDGLSRLERLGFQVRVVHPFRYPLNPLARKGTVLAGIDPLRFLRLLWAYPRYDILLSMADSSCLLFMLTKRLLRLRKPVLVIDPALSHDYPLRKRLQNLVLPYADHVIVLGRVQLEYLNSEFHPTVKSSFVHFRIDTDFFDPARADTDRPFGAEDYLFSVGNDTARDFATLVAAAEGLPIRTRLQTRKPVTLPEGGRISVHRDWIDFPGLRNRYAHARMVILPLHAAIHAGGITSLLEAMSMGKPVIATRSPGIADYVKDGENALVVSPGDPQAMRAAIERLLADPELAARLGRAARAFCVSQCAVMVYARQVADRLNECLGVRG